MILAALHLRLVSSVVFACLQTNSKVVCVSNLSPCVTYPSLFALGKGV